MVDRPEGAAPLRGRLAIAGPALLVLVALSSLLSANTFPFVTNDGLVYLQHSRDFSGFGLVVEGFRQAGYPVFLAVTRWVSGIAGADPLLSVALFQRLLLVGAGIIAFRDWRWWSLPLLAFLFAPANIAYTNFALTEALGFPLAVLVAILASRFVTGVGASTHPGESSRLLTLGLLATLGSLALFALRFTFAVFGAVPLVMTLAAWRTSYRKPVLAFLAGFVALAALYTVATTLENAEETGVASPSVGGAHVGYYYAWQQVFRHPDNRSDPSLAEFYDDGVVHAFERQLTRDGVPIADRPVLFEAEVSEMLTAAGMSELGSRVESIAWSMAGGRLHDLAGGVYGVVHSTRSDVDHWMYFNVLARSEGRQAFADALNDGRLPQAVITDPVGLPPPLPDGQTMAMVLVPLAVVIAIAGMTNGETRWMSLMTLLVLVPTALAMGWLRADNYRFLLVPSSFAIAAATSVAPTLVGRWRGDSRVAERV